MRVVQFQRIEAPEMAAFNESGRIPEDSDEFKVAAIIDMLVEHGRKKGVRGTIAITQTEAIEFEAEVQRRCAARLPNGGVGMTEEAVAPTVLEETDKMLDEFWAAKKESL